MGNGEGRGMVERERMERQRGGGGGCGEQRIEGGQRWGEREGEFSREGGGVDRVGARIGARGLRGRQKRTSIRGTLGPPYTVVTAAAVMTRLRVNQIELTQIITFDDQLGFLSRIPSNPSYLLFSSRLRTPVLSTISGYIYILFESKCGMELYTRS